MNRPGALPDPPGDLSGRRLPITETDSPLYRSHSIRYQPVFFGKSGVHRFDAS